MARDDATSGIVYYTPGPIVVLIFTSVTNCFYYQKNRCRSFRSRPLRIEYVNAFYHVMNRGAGRRPIFNTEDEQELFLALLSET